MRGLFIVCVLFQTINVFGQESPANTLEEYKIEKEKRIKLDSINGKYIPKNLDDAIITLNNLVDTQAANRYSSLPEEEAWKKLYFSFGSWIRANWSIVEGSRLTLALNELGVYHPDDMVQLIMRTYHRSLNHIPMEATQLAHSLNDERTKDWKDKVKSAPIIKANKQN